MSQDKKLSIIDSLMVLDGVAAVNLTEPSSGDLERINTAYHKTLDKLRIAKAALVEINKEELNSQRPGGGYSRSATLSFEALEKLK